MAQPTPPVVVTVLPFSLRGDKGGALEGLGDVFFCPTVPAVACNCSIVSLHGPREVLLLLLLFRGSCFVPRACCVVSGFIDCWRDKCSSLSLSSHPHLSGGGGGGETTAPDLAARLSPPTRNKQKPPSPLLQHQGSFSLLGKGGRKWGDGWYSIKVEHNVNNDLCSFPKVLRRWDRHGCVCARGGRKRATKSELAL